MDDVNIVLGMFYSIFVAIIMLVIRAFLGPELDKIKYLSDRDRRLYFCSLIYFFAILLLRLAGRDFEQVLYNRWAEVLQESTVIGIFKSACYRIIWAYLAIFFFRMVSIRKNGVLRISIILRTVSSFIIVGAVYFLINSELQWLCSTEKMDMIFFIIIAVFAGFIGNLYLPRRRLGFLIYAIAFLFALPLLIEFSHFLSKSRDFSWVDVRVKMASIFVGFILSSTWSSSWIIGKFRRKSK